MRPHPVQTSLAIDDTSVHLFQVVRETRDDGGHDAWVIVGFSADAVDLATLDFDWHRTVPVAALADGTFEPLSEGGVPVWGY